VLWIHFFVNAPFGFALGFDKETPGLMARTPRPRGASVLTTGVMITVGLAGLAITIGLLSLIELGQHHFGSIHIGQSIAFTSFALCLIVAALECRSETATVLTTDSFDSKQMNYAMIGEFILAVLVTQMDVFQRLLGTTQLNLRQFGWALVPAVVLLALWELGKLIARRSAAAKRQPEPSGALVAEIPATRLRGDPTWCSESTPRSAGSARSWCTGQASSTPALPRPTPKSCCSTTSYGSTGPKRSTTRSVR
jgi:cation transport ATPase-like protein